MLWWAMLYVVVAVESKGGGERRKMLEKMRGENAWRSNRGLVWL